MAVYDQWHKDPAAGDTPCGCGSRRRPLYPSSRHQAGRRWQVRWYDLEGRQRKRNFDLRVGANPGLHADAFDAKVAAELDAGTYTDPAAGQVTLREYAEGWRRSRPHGGTTAGHLERRLRSHVYEDPTRPGSGRTPKGGVSIGQHAMGTLARRPSMIQAWISAMPLAESSARLVAGDVSAVFAAAVDDGIVPRDPVRARSVTRPGRGSHKAKPWPLETVEAMARELPAHLAIVPYLGAGTGMRQGEMFGLAVDDITWLGRDPHIRVERQVKLVNGVRHFAPLKNRRPHTVPLAPSLAPRLAGHLELFPAVEVTLPWDDDSDREMHGHLVTCRLVLTDSRGRAHQTPRFNEAWHAAQERAGVTPRLEPGQKRKPARDDGCHALRHTAASTWLRARIDVVRVASWLGDTPAIVLGTYAHLMPDSDDDDGRAAVDQFLGSYAPDVPSGEAISELSLVDALPVYFQTKSTAPHFSGPHPF
jgi:integrase